MVLIEDIDNILYLPEFTTYHVAKNFYMYFLSFRTESNQDDEYVLFSVKVNVKYKHIPLLLYLSIMHKLRNSKPN